MRRSTVTLMLVLLAFSAPSAGNHLLAQTQAPVPAAELQIYSMLIKNALTAVNHGNLTGNYTVLRDLGSERFRQKNKASELGMTFQDVRKQKIDLSAILLLEPQLTQRPVEGQGRLQLAGFFATRPSAVRFGLIFQRVEGGWLIDDIAVEVTRPETQAQPTAAQRAAPQAPSMSASYSGNPLR